MKAVQTCTYAFWHGMNLDVNEWHVFASLHLFIRTFFLLLKPVLLFELLL